MQPLSGVGFLEQGGRKNSLLVEACLEVDIQNLQER